MVNKISKVLIASLVLGVSTAAAAESAKLTFGISGYVPVTCRATLDVVAAVPEDGVAELGALNEFCNSPAGYAVYAEHSAELSNASLIVDGRTVALEGDGSTLISLSDRAGVASRSLALAAPGDQSGGTITFRIVAH